MGSYMQNTIVVLGIMMNILGGLLSLAYIYKSCTPTGISSKMKDNYFSQIKSCFFWGLLLIAFVWFITPGETSALILTGMRIGIYTWTAVFTLSILSMFPFIRLISKDISDDYVFYLRKLSGQAVMYTAASIFVFWFIS